MRLRISSFLTFAILTLAPFLLVILATLLLSVLRANAATIIDIDLISSDTTREVIIPGCEWIDTTIVVERITYSDVIRHVRVSPTYRERRPYPAQPNPCFDENLTAENRARYCSEKYFVPTMGGSYTFPKDWVKTWTELRTTRTTYHVDTCDDCTPVPEPSSVVLLGIGGVMAFLVWRRKEVPINER